MQILFRCAGDRVQKEVELSPTTTEVLEYALKLAGCTYIAWHDELASRLLREWPNVRLGL